MGDQAVVWRPDRAEVERIVAELRPVIHELARNQDLRCGRGAPGSDQRLLATQPVVAARPRPA